MISALPPFPTAMPPQACGRPQARGATAAAVALAVLAPSPQAPRTAPGPTAAAAVALKVRAAPLPPGPVDSPRPDKTGRSICKRTTQ